MLERLHQAYVIGQLRLIKRIHALLYITEGKSVAQALDHSVGVRIHVPQPESNTQAGALCLPVSPAGSRPTDVELVGRWARNLAPVGRRQVGPTLAIRPVLAENLIRPQTIVFPPRRRDGLEPGTSGL